MKPFAIIALVAVGLLAAGCVAASQKVSFYSEKPAYAKGEAVKLKVEAFGGKYFVQGDGLAEIWRFDEKLGVWRQLDLGLGPAQKQVCLSTGLGTKLDVVPPEKKQVCARLYSTEWSWNGESTQKERKDCKGTPYDEYSRLTLPGRYRAVLKTFDDGKCTALNRTYEVFFDIGG